MGSEAKRNGIVNNKGIKSRVNRYLHSGDTKHVMAGMAIITLVFGVPWFLMNRVCRDSSIDEVPSRTVPSVTIRNKALVSSRITWKRLIKQGMTDFLQVLLLHDFYV
uniref:Uncharacterized protein n=1 Tax=Salix viminalis TaxID=40686 RepID=A0A6N2JWY1_SALVM